MKNGWILININGCLTATPDFWSINSISHQFTAGGPKFEPLYRDMYDEDEDWNESLRGSWGG